MLCGDIEERLLFTTCPDIKKKRVSIILSFSTLIYLRETDYVYLCVYSRYFECLLYPNGM